MLSLPLINHVNALQQPVGGKNGFGAKIRKFIIFLSVLIQIYRLYGRLTDFYRLIDFIQTCRLNYRLTDNVIHREAPLLKVTPIPPSPPTVCTDFTTNKNHISS